MTTLLHEQKPVIKWIEPDKLEAGSQLAQKEADSLVNNDLIDLLSHQILSCAAKVQTVAYLLGETSLPSDPVLPQVLSSLTSVARQLHYLGYGVLHLDMSANSGVQPAFKPVNMITLIENVVETFQAQAPDRCRVKTDQAELPYAWGDSEQLQIVLDNLISNALKYSAPQSPIIISAEICQVPTAKDNGQMLISVTNFGSFIPPAEQEKLFIKFYRRGQGAKGYGLGLPLARWLVELHGGQLEVESSAAEGTTFWFTIPLAAG